MLLPKQNTQPSARRISLAAKFPLIKDRPSRLGWGDADSKAVPNYGPAEAIMPAPAVPPARAEATVRFVSVRIFGAGFR